MKIRYIHPAPNGLTATIYCEDDGGYRFDVVIQSTNLPVEYLATWGAALSHLSANVLLSARSAIHIRRRKNAIRRNSSCSGEK